MIVYLITRTDSDPHTPEHQVSTVEVLTGDDPTRVETRAADRVAELDAGDNDGTGHPLTERTTYAYERVWTVDGRHQH